MNDPAGDGQIRDVLEERGDSGLPVTRELAEWRVSLNRASSFPSQLILESIEGNAIRFRDPAVRAALVAWFEGVAE